MALIYKPEEAAAAPNFTKASQGTIADKSLGGLLGDVGELFGQAVQGVDTLNLQTIQKTAYESSNNLRQAEIDNNLDALAPKSSGTSPEFDYNIASPPPPALTEALKSQTATLGKARDAKLAGKYDETAFAMRTNSAASDLKARFPGYGPQIEQAFAATLGFNPANESLNKLQALRNAVNISNTTSKNAWDTWVSSKGKLLGEKGAAEAYLATDPVHQMRIRSQVAGLEASDHNITMAKNVLELKAAQGKAAEGDALDAATTIVNNQFSKSLNSLFFDAAGRGVKSVSDAVSNIQAEVLKDPLSIDRFITAIDGRKREFIANVHKSIADTKADGSKTLAQRLASTNHLEGLLKSKLTVFDMFRDSLAAKDYNALNSGARMLDTVLNNAALNRVMSDSRVAQMFSDIKQLGPQAAEFYKLAMGSEKGRKLQGETFEAFTNYKTLEYALKGTGSLYDFKKQTDVIAPPKAPDDPTPTPTDASDQKRSGALRGIMDKVREGLGSTDPTIRANFATVLSNPENARFFLEVFKPNQRFDAWSYMNDEATVKLMQKEGGDKLKNYLEWNFNTFRNLFRDYAATAQKAGIEVDSRLNVTFSPDTTQFNYDSRIPQDRGGYPSPFTKGSAEIALDRLNTGLATMRKFSEAAGLDANKELGTSLKLMGINLDKAPEARTNLMNTILEMYNKFDASNLEGTTPESLKAGEKDPAPKLFQNAPRSSLEGRTGAIQTPAVQLASIQNNASAGSPGASRGTVEPLLSLTGSAESGNDYNAVFGLGKNPQRDLSQFSTGEVLAFQKYYTKSGSPSSAVGKYQFLRKTLNSLIKEGKLDPTEPFTPEVQDRLAVALMERRGLNEFLAGKMPMSTFVNNLAKEWAGLPTTAGVSYYEGDGLNKAQVKLPKVLEALVKLKEPQAREELQKFYDFNVAQAEGSSGVTDISGQSRRSPTRPTGR